MYNLLTPYKYFRQTHCTEDTVTYCKLVSIVTVYTTFESELTQYIQIKFLATLTILPPALSCTRKTLRLSSFNKSVPMMVSGSCPQLTGLKLNMVFYCCCKSTSMFDIWYTLRCFSFYHDCNECIFELLTYLHYRLSWQLRPHQS